MQLCSESHRIVGLDKSKYKWISGDISFTKLVVISQVTYILRRLQGTLMLLQVAVGFCKLRWSFASCRGSARIGGGRVTKKVVAVTSRDGKWSVRSAKSGKFARRFAKNHRTLLHSLSQK